MSLTVKESLITDVKQDLETRINNLKTLLEKDETKEDYSLLLELLGVVYILLHYVSELTKEEMDEREKEKYLCDLALIEEEVKYHLRLMSTLKPCTFE